MKRNEDLVTDLTEYLTLLGIRTTQEQATRLALHIELVEEANARVNLTRITDPADAVRRHAADSLTALQDVEQAMEGVLLDLGTGAGFPGIPLAICSGRRVELIDSVAKKVRELRSMIARLGLDERVDAAAGRAEALARTRSGMYAVVVARAVSELPALVELAAPLLCHGGRLICLKGSPGGIEIERADQVAALVGLGLAYRRSLDLPQGVGHRTILVYEKVGTSSVALPRREGMAQHSPLG